MLSGVEAVGLMARADATDRAAEADLRDRITDPELRDVVDDMRDRHSVDVLNSDPDPEGVNKVVDAVAMAEFEAEPGRYVRMPAWPTTARSGARRWPTAWTTSRTGPPWTRGYEPTSRKAAHPPTPYQTRPDRHPKPTTPRADRPRPARFSGPDRAGNPSSTRTHIEGADLTEPRSR